MMTTPGVFEHFEGNLFTKEQPFELFMHHIAHVVNNKGIWGGGFTRDLTRYFPYTEPYYKKANLFLGGILSQQPERYVMVWHMVAMDGVRSKDNPQPLHYDALVLAMMSVHKSILNKPDGRAVPRILCPEFGAGLAGGDLRTIIELVKDIWCREGIDVRMYHLPRRGD